MYSGSVEKHKQVLYFHPDQTIRISSGVPMYVDHVQNNASGIRHPASGIRNSIAKKYINACY